MPRGTDTGSYAFKWAREQENREKKFKNLQLETIFAMASKIQDFKHDMIILEEMSKEVIKTYMRGIPNG